MRCSILNAIILLAFVLWHCTPLKVYIYLLFVSTNSVLIHVYTTKLYYYLLTCNIKALMLIS